MLCRTVSRVWFGVIVFLSITTMPTYAVEIFKFSNYQGGHQIWFEVENFDQRIPDNNDDYVLQNDMASFSSTTIPMSSVFEFIFGTQMILSQHFGISFKLR